MQRQTMKKARFLWPLPPLSPGIIRLNLYFALGRQAEAEASDRLVLVVGS